MVIPRKDYRSPSKKMDMYPTPTLPTLPYPMSPEKGAISKGKIVFQGSTFFRERSTTVDHTPRYSLLRLWPFVAPSLLMLLSCWMQPMVSLVHWAAAMRFGWWFVFPLGGGQENKKNRERVQAKGIGVFRKKHARTCWFVCGGCSSLMLCQKPFWVTQNHSTFPCLSFGCQ